MEGKRVITVREKVWKRASEVLFDSDPPRNFKNLNNLRGAGGQDHRWEDSRYLPRQGSIRKKNIRRNLGL